MVVVVLPGEPAEGGEEDLDALFAVGEAGAFVEAGGGGERLEGALVGQGLGGIGCEVAGGEGDTALGYEEGLPEVGGERRDGEGGAGGAEVDAAVAAGDIEQLALPAVGALAKGIGDRRGRIADRGRWPARAEIDNGVIGHED